MTFTAVAAQPHISMWRLAQQTNTTPDCFVVRLSELNVEPAAKLIRVKKKKRKKGERNKREIQANNVFKGPH